MKAGTGTGTGTGTSQRQSLEEIKAAYEVFKEEHTKNGTLINYQVPGSAGSIAEPIFTKDGIQIPPRYDSNNQVINGPKLSKTLDESGYPMLEESWYQSIAKLVKNTSDTFDKNPHWKENKKFYLTAAGTLGIAAAAFVAYKRIKAARRRSIRSRSRSFSRSGRSRSRSLSRSGRSRSRYSSHSYVSAKDVQKAEREFKEAKYKAQMEAKRLDSLVQHFSSKNQRHSRRTRSY